MSHIRSASTAAIGAPGAIFFITKASVQPVTELLRAAQAGEAGFVEPGNADNVPPAQNVRFR